MHILSNKSISLIGGGGGGQSKFTLIELLVVMLVLGILMAIAIPLIGGVREAANNTKCRSNLKQLHTAIFAFATGNKERFPSALEDLVVKGYINEQTKLGNCPGSGNKQPGLVPSDYELGADLFDAGNPKTLSSTGINSNTIILADKEKEYHKAGRNAIRLDGSFTQAGGAGDDPIDDPIVDPPTKEELLAELLAELLPDSPPDSDSDNVYAALSYGRLIDLERIFNDGVKDINERTGVDEWGIGETQLQRMWGRAAQISGTIGIVELSKYMILKGADVDNPTEFGNHEYTDSIAYIDYLLLSASGQYELDMQEIRDFIETR